MASYMGGDDSLKLLKEIFNIKQEATTSIVIRASVDDVTTIEIDGLLQVNDVDISTKELSKDTVQNTSTYEITIKKISE